MKSKIPVSRTHPLSELTEKDMKELSALADLPDECVDTSDLPELTAEQLKGAIRGRFYRPSK